MTMLPRKLMAALLSGGSNVAYPPVVASDDNRKI